MGMRGDIVYRIYGVHEGRVNRRVLSNIRFAKFYTRFPRISEAINTWSKVLGTGERQP